MRKKGCSTKVDCWDLKVHNCDKCIHQQKYKTLKDMADDLGYSYNQMVEMSSGRKKKGKGKYDTQYEIIKLSGKLNKDDEIIPEVQEEVQDVLSS